MRKIFISLISLAIAGFSIAGIKTDTLQVNNGTIIMGTNTVTVSDSGFLTVQNGTNIPIVYVTEAPTNGNEYVRQNGNWVIAATTNGLATTNFVTGQGYLTASTLTGNGSSVSNVNAKLLEGYTLNDIMAVGATYYFSTNIITYGAVSGRAASLTPFTTPVTITYGPNITNGQYFGSYLISSNEMPAILQKGVYTFSFKGGHVDFPNKFPTIMGDFYIKNASDGSTVQEFESLPTAIPYGDEEFEVSINITNDIPKDGYAFLLRTKLVESDGYTGLYTSSFGPPTYSGFTFPKVNGLYVTKSEFDSAPRGATNVALFGGSKLGTYDGVTRILTLPKLDTNDVEGVASTNFVTEQGYAKQSTVDTQIWTSAQYPLALTNALAFATSEQGTKADNAAVASVVNTQVWSTTQYPLAALASVVDTQAWSYAQYPLAITNIPANLATTNFVTEQGYVTSIITNDLASTNWVNGQNFVTQIITNGLATTNFVNEIASTKASTNNVPNWDAAYNWGDHALGTYITYAMTSGWVVATHDAWITAPTATNIATIIISPYTNRITTAWQNPVDTTNWLWSSDGKEITLTNYNFASMDVVIPDMLNGLQVTKLEAFLFSPSSTGSAITSVSGGNNIHTIGAGAFNSCTNLTNISFPNVITIESTAFTYCYSLTNISFPKTQRIMDAAFNSCTNLISVSLPNVIILDNVVFQYCSSLVNISLPNTTTIRMGSFDFCSKLISINIPNVTTIGNSVFSMCPLLTSVYWGQNAPVGAASLFIGAENATNYVINPTATGWGTVFNIKPVVRLGLFTDTTATNSNQVVNFQTMTNKVESYGYVTSSITNNLATTNFVNNAINIASPVSDNSRFYSVWTAGTNSLYIVSPNGQYTNLLMKTIN